LARRHDINLNRCAFSIRLAIAGLLSLALAGCNRPAPLAPASPESMPVLTVPASPAATRTIEVVYIQGEVRIDGLAPELGDRLNARFNIQTGPGARCDLVFNSGNALSVGQNARAAFDFGAPVALIQLEQGGLSSVLKKLENLVGRDSYVIETTTAVAGVRGTSFCVWVDATSTYVCACNGTVRTIDANGGNEELLESAHHTARLYSQAGSAISMAEAGLSHHDDALLESVASRIGYSIDWTRIDD